MVLRAVLRVVVPQSSLASTGAATPATAPSAGTYSADEDDEGDAKKDTDAKPNGDGKAS